LSNQLSATARSDRAAALAVVSGALRAVYPAWLAAHQDAIVALAYE
jgi:hypothetical protein